MKKLVPVLVTIVLILATLAWAKELPTPFLKIKQMLSKSTPDENGNLMLKYEVGINGDKVIYYFHYFPKTGALGCAKQQGPYVVALSWWGQGESFVVESFAYGKMTGQETISEEAATELANKLFREMVGYKLL